MSWSRLRRGAPPLLCDSSERHLWAEIPAGLALGTLLAGCASDLEVEASLTAEQTPQAIIGGFVADSEELLAVVSVTGTEPFVRTKGSLHGQPTTTRAQYCTGSLVGPRTLLVDRACALKTKERRARVPVAAYFGVDPYAPIRVVDIAATEVPPTSTDDGTRSALANLGLIHLRDPVPDIRPLRLAPLDERHLGQNFLIVGYGQYRERYAGWHRRVGEVRLDQLTGSPFERIHGSFEAYYLTRHDGPWSSLCTVTSQDEWCAGLRAEYDRYQTRLETNHQALVGLAPGNAHPCTGDEGAPLLRRGTDGLTIHGVLTEPLGPWGLDFSLTQCGTGGLSGALDAAAISYVEQTIARLGGDDSGSAVTDPLTTGRSE